MNNESRIDNYFDKVKQNPPLIPIERAHQIISHPKAQARLKGKTNNLLKFTIMTTIIALIINAILLWQNTNVEHPLQVKNEQKTEKSVSTTKPEGKVQQYYSKDNSVKFNKQQENALLHSNSKNSFKNESFIRDDENSDSAPNESNIFKISNYALYKNLKNDSCDFEMILYDKKELELNRNDKNNTIWLSINSNQTKGLVSGEYHFSALNKNLRKPMSFSGQYFFKPDSSIKITDGKMTVDMSRANHSVGYESTMENKQKISGKYLPQPDEIEKLNPIIEKPKPEYVYPEQILDSTKFIELNRKELENLGFKLKDETIELKYLLNGGNFFTSYVDSRMSFGVLFSDNTNPSKRENNTTFLADQVNVSMHSQDSLQSSGGIVPMLITVEEGRGFVKVNVTENNLKALISKRFTKDFKTLLPVIMKKNTFDNYPKEDVVYWFLPTDEFFNRLPQEISNQLLNEYNYITAEDKSTLEKPECKYFDECKNTLNVSRFKVFPNPANEHITVTFTLPSAINGKISLADLAGRERKILQPKTSFSKGNQQLEFSINEVPEGIYLLLLFADEGIQTQRIIISR